MEDNKNNNPLYDQNGEALYFAAKEGKKTANILLGKAKTFYENMYSNDYIDRIRKSWRFYHGRFNGQNFSNHEITFTGEQGELVKLPANHYRNLAQHINVMVTANRPVMETRAVNTDYKSLAQTYLANGILDYYMREKNLENVIKKSVEMAIVLGSGYVRLEWNATAGEVFDADPETGEVQHEGEIEFSNLSPLDVVVDGTKETWNNDWVMIRTFKNRFDIMAKYPEYADKIRLLKSKSNLEKYSLSFWSNDETDDIPVYEFFHKRTESMPDGRYLLFLDNDVILLDMKMPYRNIPVFRIVPAEILGTPYGYSPMFDVYPLQEAINTTMSTIMTNQNAFGVQNLFVPTGANIQWSSLEGGMNIIEGNTPPVPINFTQTPKELFDFLEVLVQTSETLSGVNSVARGNPEASLKSGAALALVQSMALQFISGLQGNYVKLVEELGTAIINVLKDFAQTPRTVALVGKHNRPLLKEFTADDIDAISRVIVDIGNPLSHTLAGRVQMAEQMMQMKVIDNPQQYIQVISTGRLDVMFEGEQSELLLIKSENEKLMSGQKVKALAIDQHRQHILEHRSILSDVDLRNNAIVEQNVLNHIQEHIDLLRTTDPELLQLINEQPLSPLQGQATLEQSQQQVEQLEMPSQRTLERSPMNNVMQPVQNPTQGGQMVQGPSTNNIAKGQAQSLPNIPHAPAPFENLPVNAKDLIPG